MSIFIFQEYFSFIQLSHHPKDCEYVRFSSHQCFYRRNLSKNKECVSDHEHSSSIVFYILILTLLYEPLSKCAEVAQYRSFLNKRCFVKFIRSRYISDLSKAVPSKTVGWGELYVQKKKKEGRIMISTSIHIIHGHKKKDLRCEGFSVVVVLEAGHLKSISSMEVLSNVNRIAVFIDRHIL